MCVTFGKNVIITALHGHKYQLQGLLLLSDI